MIACHHGKRGYRDIGKGTESCGFRVLKGSEKLNKELLLRTWAIGVRAQVEAKSEVLVSVFVWLTRDLFNVLRIVDFCFKEWCSSILYVVPRNDSLVAKGYTQLYGVDYEETFSPVADIRAIRILISIAAYYDYEIWQMDVKTAFLNGYLDEDIYMVQPEGFVDPNHQKKCMQLKDSIYGLRKHQEAWNKRFDEEIKSFGFRLKILIRMCISIKA
ncbi:retrotransposon protein, putative, ty1-copia subclass [Tanacetum coccineum]